ncbi:MAG: CDP-diacylglycerol--glycerol-3-phosphate 3-phosphatidyltransferase [Endomicrobiaceae bacterium]|nr:CDP-diacylglycerol--glycerol-3-phosphate 3-phosphatidyltransferase [Endomicrobiaceae bacterium]MDD3053241.1 CDP-diacylglycerol--glycerol-3-phosphate 3-phosphatidyltransferase [Endomicrobiaceae bacterium]MDD3922504.1 CDP-diacylglycerol--glycerol-3-phosphate 3-phosphatidyltransferase [Endomicrobiaceae bacterium]MDD5102343.1 CDP-diacylglycerol--glycerol-3-phosphate 3-phosphatidyltransferase [Endomicrobiaceae bacterium]
MNLANKLTMLRVILVPVFILFLALDSFHTNIIALLVFIIASITDFYDGRIARQQNIITTFGIFLDPLADKLLVTSALVSFVAIYTLNIPAWMVICIISREFLITGLRSLAASQNIIISASTSGKFKTTSQIVAIITILVILIINSTLIKFYSITSYDLVNMPSWKGVVGWCLINLPYWLMFIVTILTLYSGISYMMKHKNIFVHNK